LSDVQALRGFGETTLPRNFHAAHQRFEIHACHTRIETQSITISDEINHKLIFFVMEMPL
jgi:hypothetical protein